MKFAGAHPPKGGRRIETATASARLLAQALAAEPREVELTLVNVPAPLPADAAAGAAAEARALVQGPVTLAAAEPALLKGAGFERRGALLSRAIG